MIKRTWYMGGVEGVAYKYDGLCVYVQRDIKLRNTCLYSNMYQECGRRLSSTSNSKSVVGSLSTL